MIQSSPPFFYKKYLPPRNHNSIKMNIKRLIVVFISLLRQSFGARIVNYAEFNNTRMDDYFGNNNNTDLTATPLIPSTPPIQNNASPLSSSSSQTVAELQHILENINPYISGRNGDRPKSSAAASVITYNYNNYMCRIKMGIECHEFDIMCGRGGGGGGRPNQITQHCFSDDTLDSNICKEGAKYVDCSVQVMVNSHETRNNNEFLHILKTLLGYND